MSVQKRTEKHHIMPGCKLQAFMELLWEQLQAKDNCRYLGLVVCVPLYVHCM